MSARPDEVLAPAELAAIDHKASITDPLGYEEDEDYAVRVQLGLRPIAYDDSGTKGTHPDHRPCPSWCWVAQNEEYDHEIDPKSPFAAQHHYDPRITFPATLYRGRNDGQANLVETATIETQLSCVGAQLPQISVALRYVDAGRNSHYEERLKLSLDDARDLVTTLRHLIEVATADLP